MKLGKKSTDPPYRPVRLYGHVGQNVTSEHVEWDEGCVVGAWRGRYLDGGGRALLRAGGKASPPKGKRSICDMIIFLFYAQLCM